MVILKNREIFQENIRGNIFFLILVMKTLHQRCFLYNFPKYLEHLRMAASESTQESSS